MTPTLDKFLTQIKSIFVEYSNDRYLAHKKAQEILGFMAKDKRVLYDIIKKNISNPNYLKKERHYSTLSMIIGEEIDFTFYFNIFPPLPDKRTDISFQSIHHHGNLLLSTVSAFGPGYNSILFKKGFNINLETRKTKMEVEYDYQNKLYDVSFVDAAQPHIVFYPTDFSGTYALWSDYKKSTKDIAKNIGFIRKFKKPLAKILTVLGLAEIVGLNKIEYLDFFVRNKSIIAMKEREAYMEKGDNDNFLQNIFCFIQRTDFYDKPFLEELIGLKTTPKEAKKYINMLIEKKTISDVFFEGHLNVAKVNLLKQDIIEATS